MTSTLAICTDPCPPMLVQKPDGSAEKGKEEEEEDEEEEEEEEEDEEEDEEDEEEEEPVQHRDSAQNGVEAEPIVGDKDEIMTEVEEAETEEDMAIDMEALEEIVVGSSETNSTPTTIS